MKKYSKLIEKDFDNSIAKNTLFNLLGYLIPMLFAVILIPIIINGLGTERFGILNIAWIIIGYFGFFDFGIGRALTKIIAEKISLSKIHEIPSFFWTSFFLILFISLISTVILFLLIPTIVLNFLKITKELQYETLNAFYFLIFSIPLVSTTACIRGLLEAYQRFDLVNIIRVGFGISTFLTPIIVLFFSNSLVWIVFLLLIARIIIWILYLYQCFKINPQLKDGVKFNKQLIKPIFKISTWMMISNIVLPIITYSDRFLIGGLVSAKSVAYYATPYEVITKLTIFSGAVAAVLFPTFSANYPHNPSFTYKLSLRVIQYIFLFLYPVINLTIIYSYYALNIWLGYDFALNSTPILQLLSVGVLFNSIAYIPYSFIEGIGRPDITAKVQLVELPLYVFLLYIGILYLGILGVALVYTIRMILDSIILLLLMKKLAFNNIKFTNKNHILLFIILILFSFSPVLFTNVIIKIFTSLVVLITFYLIIWKYLISKDEKKILILETKKLFKK